MKDPRTPAPVESAKRTAVRRRAKRGLVAGYIHEISARHSSSDRPRPPAERVPQPARSA
jgi:hypothetical protein